MKSLEQLLGKYLSDRQILCLRYYEMNNPWVHRELRRKMEEFYRTSDPAKLIQGLAASLIAVCGEYQKLANAEMRRMDECST